MTRNYTSLKNIKYDPICFHQILGIVCILARVHDQFEPFVCSIKEHVEFSCYLFHSHLDEYSSVFTGIFSIVGLFHMGIIHYCFRHMIRRNGLRPETESMLPERLMFQANLGE